MSNRRWWPHILIVTALALIQFGVLPIYRTVYTSIIRQRLLAHGARPCAAIGPFDAENMPASCDVMTVRMSPRGFTEHVFYGEHGETRTTIRFQDSTFISAQTMYFANLIGFVLPLTALLVSAIATLHKMLRTRSLFTTQMWRHGWDRTELMLHLYSIPVFLSGIVSMWLRGR
jgi:hypothetical protein